MLTYLLHVSYSYNSQNHRELEKTTEFYWQKVGKYNPAKVQNGQSIIVSNIKD